jgi:Zn-finger nucleic acid-binding protein
MQCPKCDAPLAASVRDGLTMQACPRCGGMWLTAEQLDALEDETFKLGDAEKGSLTFTSEPSALKCPECGAAMRTFQYRLYDLDLDFCAEGHGYWLEAGEDKRVLELMREEAGRLGRSHRAEDAWAAHLRHWRSGSFLEKLRNLFR